MTSIIELETALLLSVVFLVLSLFLFSLVSARKIASSNLSLLMYSAMQLGLGLAVVALKLTLK